MYKYNQVYVETKPLREQLISVRRIVEEKTQVLAIKKAELEKVNNKIRDLEEMFAEKVRSKEELSKKIKDC
jgi:dynein heavy chain